MIRPREGSTGALWSERVGPHFLRVPIVEGSIAINPATVVEELASRTGVAIVFRVVGKTLGTEEWTPLSMNAIAGPHVRSDAAIGQPLQELAISIARIGPHRFRLSSLPCSETGEH